MDHLLKIFTDWIGTYGLAALFVTLFFETFGLPLPGESALIATSAIAAGGSVNIVAVAVVAALAAIAGDNVAYLIGRRYGRTLILSYGERFGITAAKYEQAEAVTRKYGAYVVILARFFVLLRQLNGLVAGSAGMPWRKFIVANVIGSTLWVLFWTTLAYQFGKDVSIVPRVMHHLSLIAAIVIPVALVLIFILARRGIGTGSFRNKS